MEFTFNPVSYKESQPISIPRDNKNSDCQENSYIDNSPQSNNSNLLRSIIDNDGQPEEQKQEQKQDTHHSNEDFWFPGDSEALKS